jgi:hypothetical protein
VGKSSIGSKAVYWLLWAFLLGVFYDAFAVEVPHVTLDIVYNERTRQVHIQAETALSSTSPRFYLSKLAKIESVELDSKFSISDSDDAHVFHLKDDADEVTVQFDYSVLLPEPDESVVSTGSSGRVDWSGSSTNAFLPGSRLWYPFFNQPSTAHLTIKTTAGLRAIAPGSPVAYIEENGYSISILNMSQPILGIDLMIGQWDVQQKVMSGIEEEILLQTYFDEANSEISKEYLDLSERYINFYENLIGAYPYSSFTVVSSPFPTGLGMPSLTYISEKILKYSFIKTRSLPHEIVHNWWGNGVRVDYNFGNWSEGLTTYLADYWQVELASEQAAQEMRYGWMRNYASITDEDEKSLQAFTTRHHTASSTIGYGKGAMFFHMLRKTIGNEPFINCLKVFWLKYRFKSASFHDIREACQSHTNIDLTVFFDSWIPTVGAPELRATITQTMPSDYLVSVNQGGNWVYPLDIDISSDTHVIESTIMMHGNEITIPISVDNVTSTKIKLDPNFNVWRQLHATELVGTLRDFIAAKNASYIQLNSSSRDGSEILSSYFMENAIQAEHIPNFNNSKKNPIIISGDSNTITEYLSRSDNANDSEYLMPILQTDFVMVSTYITNTPTLLISTPKSITDKDFSRLVARARHYGKYSWLKISPDGNTKRGKWPIRDKEFSFSN